MSTEPQKLKHATAINWVDKLSCLGLIGGTTASLVTQQVAFATVPLSLIVAAQIFSRQHKVSALVNANLETAQSIHQVEQTLDSVSQAADQQLQGHERTLDTLTQENNQYNLESITIKERLDEQSKRLAEQAGQLDALDSTLLNIKEITAVSSLDSGAASAESHFTRGTHQEKLGHLEVAIEDYSQAIERSPDFAEAYLRRGLAKSELGRKQSAVIDLNLATKHFFEAGDLKNYQRAKDIASNMHVAGDAATSKKTQEESPEAAPAVVSLNGLFGG